ncbi:unnamed protein product [Trichobilharzia regenti]|nr:unnamed protein product [Trichobilharzia regenti]
MEEENHRLLNKLNLLEEMEIVYRGEIETLKETITNLEQKKSRASQNIDCQSANSLEISRKKNQLTEELEAARNSETELLEQLEVYHKKLNKICRERHSELEDAEAQYEALQNQPSSTQTTSLFDEVSI